MPTGAVVEASRAADPEFNGVEVDDVAAPVRGAWDGRALAVGEQIEEADAEAVHGLPKGFEEVGA